MLFDVAVVVASNNLNILASKRTTYITAKLAKKSVHNEDDSRCFRLSLSKIAKLPCSRAVAYDFESVRMGRKVRSRKALQSGVGVVWEHILPENVLI